MKGWRGGNADKNLILRNLSTWEHKKQRVERTIRVELGCIDRPVNN